MKTRISTDGDLDMSLMMNEPTESSITARMLGALRRLHERRGTTDLTGIPFYDIIR